MAPAYCDPRTLITEDGVPVQCAAVGREQQQPTGISRLGLMALVEIGIRLSPQAGTRDVDALLFWQNYSIQEV